MKTINQKGFSAVHVLIFVLILAIIGGAGYYVWHANQNRDTNKEKTAVSSPSKTPKKQAQASKVQPATRYLNIDDWGVRMPYIQGDNDTYTVTGIDPGPPSHPQLSARFIISANLKQAYPDSYTCSSQGAGIISRSPNLADQGNQAAEAKLVNGYYYDFNTDIDTCAPGAATAQAQVNANTQKMFAGLEAIPAR